MPLNYDHITQKCSKKPCGNAVRTCRQFVLLRYRRSHHRCIYFGNGIINAEGKFVSAEGHCEKAPGDKGGCGNELDYDRKHRPGDKRQFKALRCFVTKSVICQAVQFKAPPEDLVVKSQKCEVRKSAWCIDDKTKKKETLNEQCSGALSSLANTM